MFLLLVEIDGGRISLDELCDEYFSSGNSAQGKYSQFVLAVVIPFSITTEKVVNKLINSQKRDENDDESGDGNDFNAEFFGNGDGKNNGKNAKKMRVRPLMQTRTATLAITGREKTNSILSKRNGENLPP